MSSGKRMRCSSPPQAVAVAVAADWSFLPDLLLDVILSKLNTSLKDCLSLAATCRNWRSAAKQSKTSITMNWLMSTTPNNDRAATAFPVFHDVVSAKRHHLYLPEIEGFTVFGSRFASDSHSCVRYNLIDTDTEITGTEFATPPELLDHCANSKMEPFDFPHFTRRFQRLQKLLYTKYHLVEIKGRLCLVVKFFKRGSHSFIEIFEFDLETNRWSRVESLGDSCLVIQDNLNLSVVDARDDPELVPGCVYYPITDAGCLHDPFMWWRQHIRSYGPSPSVDSGKNPISRLIYYPSTSMYDGRARVWATSQYYTDRGASRMARLVTWNVTMTHRIRILRSIRLFFFV